MRAGGRVVGVLVVLAATAVPSAGQEAGSRRAIATFDEGLPDGAEVRDVLAPESVAADSHAPLDSLLAGGAREAAAAIRGGALLLRGCGAEARITMRVEPGAMAGSFAVTLRVLAPPSGGTVRIRLVAYGRTEAGGPTGFQRAVDLTANGAWQDLVLPLAAWRWQPGTVGAWAMVDRLAVLLEGAPWLLLDECGLEPPTPGSREAIGAVPRSEPATAGLPVYRRLFPGEGEPPPAGRFLLEPAGGFASILDADEVARRIRIYTDAGDAALAAADAARLARRLDRLAPFVRRVFDVGGAVAPPLPDVPPVLLIYSDRAGMEGFFERLARHWNVAIAPPRAAGYTVQEFAACTLDPAAGWRRPTFLHETVHAALPLWTGLTLDRDRWLHEALANYLQIALYPGSLGRDAYVDPFRRGIGDGTFFRPLAEATGPEVPTDRYAQLASLAAYLVTERPAWLPAFARARSAGRSQDDFLAAQGTTLAALEADWLAWGRARFAERLPPGPDGEPVPAFERPPEWGPED